MSLVVVAAMGCLELCILIAIIANYERNAISPVDVIVGLVGFPIVFGLSTMLMVITAKCILHLPQKIEMVFNQFDEYNIHTAAPKQA